MGAPLDGVKVVELTTMITGPLAGMLLADLGASVIKVENREGGDVFRNFRGGLYSASFLSYNRNKRSMTLDLRSARGKEIFRDLIAKSDVLIDNFRAGVLDRLGFSYPDLSKLNPRLIHASITGFGADGPYRDRPAYDAVAQAIGGVMVQLLDPDAPQVSGPTIADNVTGFYAAYAVLGALYERERTGKGRRIETNMLEATVAFAPDAFVGHKRYGTIYGPLTRVAISQSFSFRAADRLFAVHLSSQQKFWDGVLAAFERQDLAAHPDFVTRDLRIQNYKALWTELSKTTVTQPFAHWAPRLAQNDVPFAPVLGVEEVFDDPQVQHLGTFYSVDHPVEGEVWGPHSPVLFEGARPTPVTPPPTLGEHTDAILAELDIAREEIARLREQKVV